MRSVVAAALALTVVACEPDVAPPPPPVAGVTALFDPLANPPVVPTPNDLAFRGGDGVHLNIVDQPTASAAERALNQYLRQLDGFPPSSTARTRFSGAIDPASLTVATASAPGSVVVVDTTTAAIVDGVSASLGSDGATLTLTARRRWPSGHRIAVAVFGDTDPMGLRPQSGVAVLASPSFFVLRAPAPLLARCGDPTNVACPCPAVTDPSCHSTVRGLSDDQARQAEPERADLDRALTPLWPLLAPHLRDDLVLFWTFTITTQPVLEVDPASGTIPFPNDVLIDPATGQVALPLTAGDPLAPLLQPLNTLDGFSTSAAITAPVDAVAATSVDTASVVPGRSALVVNLDPSPAAEQPTFAASASDGQIALQPLTALVPDQRRYAVALTRAITVGGVALMPAPATVLLLQAAPVFDGAHTLVTALDDAQALALERLRAALQPLLAQLESRGLPRQQLAALWTFTTQSIARPLAALDAYPTQAELPTDVTATVYTDFTSLPSSLHPLVADVRAVVLGTFTSRLVYDPATRLVQFLRARSPKMPAIAAADLFTVSPPSTMTVTIHFWLTLPVRANAPVVIVQHGLGGWRGDVFSLGEDMARGGRAAIGFDLDRHGARTRCSADSHCASGGCDVTSGVCANGFAPRSTSDDPLACVLAAFSGDRAADCAPAASGNGAIDPSSLLGGRAGGFQYVVDAAQLIRVLAARGTGSLAARLGDAGLAVDAASLSFIGHSLGAIHGALLFATDPSIAGAGVLSVGGGHIFEILADGVLRDPVDQLLASLHIARGSPAYAQLVQTARWALDPVDPWSVARFIVRAPSFSYVTGTANPPKLAIVQEAGDDHVILPAYEAALSSELWWPSGVDSDGRAQGRRRDGSLVSTFFADATHTTLLSAMPSAAMRVQAVTYVLSDGAELPAPTP
jgi:hypothetical protein